MSTLLTAPGAPVLQSGPVPYQGGLVAYRLRIQWPSTVQWPDGQAPAWVNTQAYTVGAVVTTNNGQTWWQCTTNAPVNNPPPASGSSNAYWTLLNMTLVTSSIYATQMTFTTIPGQGLPYIVEAPTGDGPQIDPLTGETTLGSYRFLVIDAPTTPASGFGPGYVTSQGIITTVMADATGRNTLLSRRAYGEISRDGGSTWQIVVAGYVTRVLLTDAATYEWTIGETRRIEQSAQVFQTIAPGLAMGTCLLGGPVAAEISPGHLVQKPPIKTPIGIGNWDPHVVYVSGAVAQAGSISYLGTKGSTNVQPGTDPTTWMPILTGKLTTAHPYVSTTAYAPASTTLASDGNIYLARVPSTGVSPIGNPNNWFHLAPPSTSAPHQSQQTVQASNWSSVQNFIVGSVTSYLGAVYVATQNSGPAYGGAQIPSGSPSYWTPCPIGVVPIGLWHYANTYYAGQSVIAMDGNIYLAVQQNSGQNPVTDSSNTYWVPLSDVPFPPWGMIPDYGGANCQVIATGGATQTLRIAINSAWIRNQGTIQAGHLPWSLYGPDAATSNPAAFPKWAIDWMNAPIPALCAAWGPAPMNYSATYNRRLVIPPGGWPGIKNPPNLIKPQQGGTVDTFTGDSSATQLGWVIGGLALQITIVKTGQTVTVNAYPQYGNPDVTKTSVTLAPQFVIQHPLKNPQNIRGACFYADWHDFYLSGVDNNGNLIASPPVDQSGSQVGLPAVGTQLQVRAVVVPISSDWPLHIAMHPVDLIARIWDNLLIPYDVANLATVRQQLGSNLLFVGRITASMTAQDFFDKVIAGPCGLAMRVAPGLVQSQYGMATGAYQLVLTRQLPTALPAQVWDDTMVSGQSGGGGEGVFDLDDQYVCQQVAWTYKSYMIWAPTMSQSRANDEIIELDNNLSLVSNDFAVYGSQTQTFDLPGSYGSPTLTQPQAMAQWASARTNEIFELYSRSATQSSADVLAPNDTVNVGDLVVWASQRLPNPALNARGGSRIMRVLKRSVLPEGSTYLMQDIGPAAQPAQTVPTFTLATDPSDTGHEAILTITNIGALRTAYPNGHVAIALIAQTNAPGTAESGIRQLDMPIANIPTTGTVLLPAQALGAKLWVQMQARPGGGSLPSIWTAWQSIQLVTPTPIENLTATVSTTDAGQCALSWQNLENPPVTPITIWLMSAGGLTGSYSVLLSQTSLPGTAGTTAPISAQTFNSAGASVSGGTYAWSTSNPAVVTITGTGATVTLNFVSAGTATITCTDTAHGSAVGTCFVTVTAAAGVGSVVITPSSYTTTTGSGPQSLAVTVYNTLGVVMSSPPTITVNSSNTSVVGVTISGGTITATPGGQVGTATITATCSGFNGTSTCTAIFAYNNLAQAARAGGKTYLCSVVQNYPSDNFAMVGGVTNTALGLPFISAGYGSAFTNLGVVDGNIWPELVDTNGVAAFSATATAATANNAALAALTTQLWYKVRVRIDELRALAVSTGAAVFCIGNVVSGSGAGKKIEVYVQQGATAGTFSAITATYATGNVRTCVNGSGSVSYAAIPNGCFINIIGSVDTTGAGGVSTYVYDDNGHQYGASVQTAMTTALSTDTGANGCIFLNSAYNTSTANGPTVAMRYGGIAVYSGVPQGPLVRYLPANTSDSGIVAMVTITAYTSGTIPSLPAAVGQGLICSAGVTGQYDNGGPMNWNLWTGNAITSGGGGECTDENQWKEYHAITAMTSASAMTFSNSWVATFLKTRSLGIRHRAYLFEGTGTAYSGYTTYVTSATTATQALQAYVNGTVGYAVTNYGTAAQGGIRVWNIANEFLQGGAWQTCPWYTYLGAAWVPDVAAMVYAIDPTCIIMINLDNIELASNTAQQNAVKAVMNAIIAKGIPAAQVMLGMEFHLHNEVGFSSADASNLVSQIPNMLPAGCMWCPSECDTTDKADPGTQTTQRIDRQQKAVTLWQGCCTPSCWGASGVWGPMYGIGTWGKNPLSNWLNITNVNPRMPIGDDVEYSALTDVDWTRMGGAYSNRDVYGVFMDFLATMTP